MTEIQSPQHEPFLAPHQHLQWGGETLWQDLEPLLPGLSIEVVARTESTNSALIEAVRSANIGRGHDARSAHGRRAHDLQPCLLVAEHQTHGRGRMGRAWHSTAGASLTFSLAMPLQLQDWSGLSLVVGAALAEALEPSTELPVGQTPRLRLKWPNDLWLDQRKLGGVLIETVPVGDLRMAIIGVGLNVAHTDASHESQAAWSSGFACLQELIPGISSPQALARVAKPLVQAVQAFQAHGFAAWQAAYAQRDALSGQAITAGALEGVARGISGRGELLLDTRSGLQAINGGEVSIRLQQRPLAAPAA